MDGIEVLKRVKADERTRVIPAVMITSSAEERDIAGSYRPGVNSYATKPVEVEHFSEPFYSLKSIAPKHCKLLI